MSEHHLSHFKTRFCPSPTGLLHLGNMRTALFSALLAKHTNGKFLLRIEDTDQLRSKQEYIDRLQADLLWMELVWQEGPGCETAQGPYFQSQRQAVYDDYYQRLENAKLAYPCFCTEDELAMVRKIQRSAGQPPRYPGTCRHLTEDQVNEKLAAGLKPTLRFEVPIDETIHFNDLVRGEQDFRSDDIGDFIIRRADGTPPFMYCNAIDDSLMGVTHVLRGEDHLTNTPRQIMILQALGLAIPHYGHIALIVGPDGSPLSKRHGSRSIAELREEGYFSIAIMNYLARLGHYYGHDKLSTFNELAEQFKLESLSKSPAKFNLEQLNYWQKIVLENLDAKQIWDWFSKEVQSLVPEEHVDTFITAIKPNIRFPREARQWAEILFTPHYLPNPENLQQLNGVTVDYFKCALTAFEIYGPNLPAILEYLKQNLNVKGKELYHPLRIALTGFIHGPELGAIFLLMDSTEIKRRLHALQSLYE